MTLIDPAERHPSHANAGAWAEIRNRSTDLAHRTAQRALELAAAPPTEPTEVSPIRPAGGRLRYVPPVAALGVAAVLQVVAMTDLAGGPVAKGLASNPQLAEFAWIGYLAGLLLGLAVASCVEGGAAYLMDLYDKHLMARDSTWLLRIGMAVYVGASAGLLHWYLDYRHMPTLVSWVLAGMSGLSLFLWSRGSRWANRTQMRASGHLDPATPKLPAAAKMWHPWRWLVTQYLISWEPAQTPEEARQRYADWRTTRRAAPTPDNTTQPNVANRDGDTVNAPDEDEQQPPNGAPSDGETPAQKPRQDIRSAQDIETVVRALAAADPKLSRRRIARLAHTSPTNVRRILGPDQSAGQAQTEELESAPPTSPAEVAA
ncbi:hypothetical protein [Actinoplanes sp. CA-252034]|uniref:hypothetical protein n=1 Tax=Actinoplanes sp. CA-252034 TaxID=3239906 RepID=UPI003D994950